MHELSITQSILDLALQHLPSQSSQITDLYLVVGQLSSIVDDSVQFYWDIICKGTPAEGATLHFRRLPAKFQCEACGQTYLISESPEFSCPHCQSRSVQIIQGEEFYLESIQVDEDNRR